MCTTKEEDYILFKCIQSKANEPLLEKAKRTLYCNILLGNMSRCKDRHALCEHGHNSKEK